MLNRDHNFRQYLGVLSSFAIQRTRKARLTRSSHQVNIPDIVDLLSFLHLNPQNLVCVTKCPVPGNPTFFIWHFIQNRYPNPAGWNRAAVGS
jgi:hypothetical protein